jgi:hypothetical protein
VHRDEFGDGILQFPEQHRRRTKMIGISGGIGPLIGGQILHELIGGHRFAKRNQLRQV